jgi:hypothetical protein
VPRRSFTVRVREDSPEGIVLTALTVRYGTFRAAVRALLAERLEREAAAQAVRNRDP